MKKPIIFISLLLAGLSASAQESFKFQNRNNVHLELGGYGLVYSLNYERFLINQESFKLSGQIGGAYYPAQFGLRDTWFPLMLNQVYNKGNHHFETGIGAVVNREAVRDAKNEAMDWIWSDLLAFRLGYRYQTPQGPWVFRAGFTPFLETDLINSNFQMLQRQQLTFIPYFALSIGYGF